MKHLAQTLAAAASIVLLAVPAGSQEPSKRAADAAKPAPAPVAADSLGRQTPSGTVSGFLAAAGRRDYSRAARYLDTRLPPAQAEELAAQLKVLMDRGLSVDLDRISRRPEGEEDQRAGPNRELIGAIEGRNGEGSLPVVLERVHYGVETPIWLFSSETLRKVPSWHEAYQPSLFERYLPAAARGPRFAPISWLLTLIVCGILFVMAFAVARLARLVVDWVRRRRSSEEARRQRRLLVAPFEWLLFGVAARASAGSMLTLRQRQLVGRAATLVIIGSVAWIVIRVSATVVARWSRRMEEAGRTERIAFVRLAGRLFQAAVVFAAALAMLDRVGVELTPVLAGLGVGGIAVALASQKTLENLFGGMMVIGDSPVRIGNFCRVGAMTGTVEDIGLRSTRIRTAGRTVISVPNAEMAAVSLENFGARDKILFNHTVSVRYGTTCDQLRAVLEGSRAMLAQHPQVEAATVRVRALRFAPTGIEIELFAYVLTEDQVRFLAVQEELLLGLMDLVESHGTGFAVQVLARDVARS